MNLLIVTSEFPPRPGGIGNHAYGLFLSLKKAGHRVQVLSNSRDEAQEGIWLKKNGLEGLVHYIPRTHPPLFTYLKRCWELYRRVGRIPQQEKVGIIFSGKFSLWMMAALPFSKQFKAIAVVHGSEILQNAIGGLLFRRAFQRADAVVSVSAYTQQKLLGRYKSLSNKCRVINNGFLPPSFGNYKKAKKSLEIGTCCLITVGSISHRKGQINVLRALPEIRRHFSLLRYEIIGIPTEIESLKTEICKLGLDQLVYVRGSVSEAHKWRYLSKASVFLMLSQELPNGDFEGFGIAILEANSLGLPAIGSKNSGITDSISHGYSGFLVDPNNPLEISKALQKIMSEYDTFSRQAMDHASRFLWDKKVVEYLEALNEE